MASRPNMNRDLSSVSSVDVGEQLKKPELVQRCSACPPPTSCKPARAANTQLPGWRKMSFVALAESTTSSPLGALKTTSGWVDGGATTTGGAASLSHSP